MAYNVFISYDNKDADLARDLSKRLEKAGLAVMTSTGKIPDDIKQRIEKMTKADQAIFLITDNAIGGAEVLFDMGVAAQLRKPLTPIVLGLKPKQLPDIFEGLDFVKYDDLERYIGRLQRMAEEAAKPSAKSQSKSEEPSKSAA